MSCVSDCVVCRFFFSLWESCASKISHWVEESKQRHSKIRREGMHFSSGSDKKRWSIKILCTRTFRSLALFLLNNGPLFLHWSSSFWGHPLATQANHRRTGQVSIPICQPLPDWVRVGGTLWVCHSVRHHALYLISASCQLRTKLQL